MRHIEAMKAVGAHIDLRTDVKLHKALGELKGESVEQHFSKVLAQRGYAVSTIAAMFKISEEEVRGYLGS